MWKFFKSIFATPTSATYDHTKQIMIVTYSDNNIYSFKGSGTVWHTYPMMRRCGTVAEIELSEIWEYINEHGNPYPTAHQ